MAYYQVCLILGCTINLLRFRFSTEGRTLLKSVILIYIAIHVQDVI